MKKFNWNCLYMPLGLLVLGMLYMIAVALPCWWIIHFLGEKGLGVGDFVGIPCLLWTMYVYAVGHWQVGAFWDKLKK